MTYALHTENKGFVEAGYFSIVTQEVRIGDDFIPTAEFCKFVAGLATGNNHLSVPTIEGRQLDGCWDPTEKLVRIGQYEICGEVFGGFVDYIFNGGWFGWKPEKPEWRPDFVRRAIDHVRKHAGEAQRGSYLDSVHQKLLPRLEELV